MSHTRKDDHLKYAPTSQVFPNSLAAIKLIHHSLPAFSLNDINLETTILGRKFPYPFYINAMTGGTKAGDELNLKLAALANYFDIPFFLGSQSLMLKDPSLQETYQTLRKAFPNLFIVANVNPNIDAKMAKTAINVVGADALAIHLNSLQELTMAEGDRDFSAWSQNIKDILAHVTVPVIVKEVGYGMHDVTLTKLEELGVDNIDISGTGGTNFTAVESKRNGKENEALLEFGRSTLDSLLSAVHNFDFNVYASGGITSATDIIKALALGARGVGMANYFLTLSKLSMAKMVEAVEALILDLKKIMVLLDAKTIHHLTPDHLIM